MFIIITILAIMFGPPIVLTTIGRNQNNKKSAKTYYIFAVVYLIVGLGICGSIISSI